jgi:hypothetical protein
MRKKWYPNKTMLIIEITGIILKFLAELRIEYFNSQES